MKSYSQDLRERAISALEAGETQAEIADRFSIHKSTLEKWWYRYQATGSCAALSYQRGPERKLKSCEDFIRAQIKKQPDVTLEELCDRVAKEKGIIASVSMMCRELQILKLPQKKSLSTTAKEKRRVSKL